jgi:pimeloyl-ACP methyl ester carboxylesterase
MAYVERDDVRLYYERTGEGPPLLLVSPLGWSARHWDQFQVSHFAADFEVITFDHRGTGRSTAGTQPYSTRLFARDVVHLLEELDLLEPVFLLGHSSGGGVVQWVCLDQPEAVRGAVLVASGSGRVDERPVARSLSPELVATLVEEGWPVFLQSWLQSPEMFFDAAPEVVETFLGAHRGEYATGLLSYLRHLQAGLEHETTAQLSEIEVPCFILVGDRDEAAAPGSANRIETSLELAKHLFYAEYVEIEDAALGLHIERPEAFNEAVRDFLIRH